MSIDVNTPGDALLVHLLLTGEERHCTEWENRTVGTITFSGKEFPWVHCPPGCIVTEEDIKAKCNLPELKRVEKEG